MKTGDFKTCYEAAMQFSNVVDLCFDGDCVKWMTNAFYPSVVNASVACELLMKAIMIKRSASSEFKEGHDLKILFEALPISDQSEIERKFAESYTAKQLSVVLDDCKMAFVYWRYPMEKEVGVDITGLLTLLSTLKEYVKQI